MSDTAPAGDAPKPAPPPSAPDPAPADAPAQLPDDHPLVKTLAAQKDELKALREKARRLDEIDEASKTEAQKAAEKLAAAEKAAADAEARVLRRDLALEHKLSKDDAALLDTITDEASMKALAARLAPREDDGKPRPPKPDPNQGRNTSGTASTGEQFAAAVDGLFSH